MMCRHVVSRQHLDHAAGESLTPAINRLIRRSLVEDLVELNVPRPLSLRPEGGNVKARALPWVLMAMAATLVCRQSPPPSHLLGTPSDWSRGAANAPVVLVEYGDYQCPPCVTLNRGLEASLRHHPKDVRFVFRHFPTKQHRNAEDAAQAAEAAGAQGKFWHMHDKLYEGQRDWYGVSDPIPIFTRYAAELGLDSSRFVHDVRAKRFLAKIRASKEEAQRLGVRGAPALFVNGERVRRLPLRRGEVEALITDALSSSAAAPR